MQKKNILQLLIIQISSNITYYILQDENCEVTRMKISTFKSETMVLDQIKVAFPLQVGELFLYQVEFKYLGVFFTMREGWTDRRISAASAVKSL